MVKVKYISNCKNSDELYGISSVDCVMDECNQTKGGCFWARVIANEEYKNHPSHKAALEIRASNDGFLYDLAKEYEDRCEEYDQSVCTMKRHGVAIPETPDQFRLVNLNAKAITQEIERKANERGFTWQDVKKVLTEMK